MLNDKHKRYLDDLRKSGVTNMFGAGVYLEAKFGMDRKEAKKVLAQWMKEFTPENDTAK